MKEQILLNYLSRQLHTNIHILDNHGTIMSTYCPMADFADPYLKNLNLQDLLPSCKKNAVPLMFSYDLIHYALIASHTWNYLIGPLRITPVTVFNVTIQAETALDILWYTRLHSVSFDQFLENTYLLANFETETEILKEEIQDQNLPHKNLHKSLQHRYSTLLFENTETATLHNPYSQELREQTSIENGDVDALKRAFSEVYTGEVGTLSKNELRHVKNVGIVLTTLASRSAIRGGLSPEIAYSLSDTYIQQIEEIQIPSNLVPFIRDMEVHYTNLVKEIKEKGITKKNVYIEQCKKYIFSHLHDRITVDVLANELGYNPDYLSHLFKQQEGIGISEYILKEKIDRSKNLLIYTQYSYSEIASYLGFSSQSHFGQIFKRFTGETPHRFRLREKTDDFY